MKPVLQRIGIRYGNQKESFTVLFGNSTSSMFAIAIATIHFVLHSGYLVRMTSCQELLTLGGEREVELRVFSLIFPSFSLSRGRSTTIHAAAQVNGQSSYPI